jgi:hypothetical protein
MICCTVSSEISIFGGYDYADPWLVGCDAIQFGKKISVLFPLFTTEELLERKKYRLLSRKPRIRQ